MIEPRVISGHPTRELESAPAAPEPHWRPWGVKWEASEPEPVVIYVCANCERVRTVLWLSRDRWLCTACRNEGTQRPALVQCR